MQQTEISLEAHAQARAVDRFHRARIAALSNTLGAWTRCGRPACRRAGACRGANDVLPRCLLPVVMDVGACVGVCAAAIPGAAPRVRDENSIDAQTARITRRIAGIIEHEIEAIERAQERNRAHGTFES